MKKSLLLVALLALAGCGTGEDYTEPTPPPTQLRPEPIDGDSGYAPPVVLPPPVVVCVGMPHCP